MQAAERERRPPKYQTVPKRLTSVAAMKLEYEPVKGLSSGLRVLVDVPFLRSERHQQQHWRANREGMKEKLSIFEDKFLLRCQRLGIPMFAHCVMRTADEQNDAFERGVSKARAGQSPHQYGCAVDLIHGVKAWKLERESWLLLGHMGKEVAIQNGIDIVWGGDFRSLYDPAHWELANWRELAGIR